MGRKVAFLSLALILLGIVTASAQIQTKIDEKGRTVFYNIPPKKAAPLYYSPRAGEYLQIIEQIAGHHGVDADLVKAVIQVESSYNPRAVSPKGASGLMQLMPATALRYGVRQIFDPKENIEGGVKYLRDLIELFKSDLQLVVAAYNAGEGIVQRLNRIPNYQETQNYVQKVLALYKGDPDYKPTQSASDKPRIATYYKYVDTKGVTHYSLTPVSGVQIAKVMFYY